MSTGRAETFNCEVNVWRGASAHHSVSATSGVNVCGCDYIFFYMYKREDFIFSALRVILYHFTV